MTIYVVNKKLGADGHYVGRPSPLGNPYRPKDRFSVGETLPDYEAFLKDCIRNGDAEVIWELKQIAMIHQLQGDMNILCWCAPGPCHGDVVKRAVEENWVGELQPGHVASSEGATDAAHG